MSKVYLQDITLPTEEWGDKTYSFVQTDADLDTAGDAADAKAVGDEISDLKQDYNQLSDEMPNKANIDGSYDNMTVGNAKQLVATVGITDKTPYNFRTSGGSADIGDREVDKIVGGTIAWNQHSDNSRQTTTLNGITFTNNGDGSVTVNGTATETTTFNSIEHTGDNAIYGHVYLIAGCPSGFSGCYLQDPMQAGTQNADYGSGRVIKRTSASTRLLTQIYIQGSATITNAVFKPQLIDLTQMFGSTIANYIYGLEQSQAGAGVAWFKKLFPKPYYAYNAGSLMSVQTSEHKMVGFNAWDFSKDTPNKSINTAGEEVNISNWVLSDFIGVIPNMDYYFKDVAGSSYSVALGWYDSDKNCISTTYWGGADFAVSGLRTSPPNARYVRAVRRNTSNEACINLSWDGEKDGTYEPYEEHSYSLDDELTLRGIPKLDSANNLYYDGDTYESDGTVTRRYGIVDLGSLTWGKYITADGAVNPYRWMCSITTGLNIGGEITTINCTSSKYSGIQYENVTTGGYDNVCSAEKRGYINVVDTSKNDLTAEQFKTAMSGVYLVYELATPTTETAEPFTNPQIVDDFGTEEYIDAGVTASTPTRDVAIPVGHETVYQANLRAKLEMAPNSPDGDGDYIVRQTNGENEYVLLEEELPSAPSSDGTYVLKATVASGTVTLTWVEET